MKQIRSQMYPFERLTREPGHGFFGYYDLQPWSGDGCFHLAHRVAFMDRMPAATDCAEVGMIRLYDGQFIPLGSTYAWNFQQGAMLQWDPRRPDERIYYNVRHARTFKCVRHDIRTGEQRLFGRPLANLSSDGNVGLSINFSRLFDFRPGYGYAGVPDPFADEPAPDEDGIWLLDMQSGRETLVVPLSALQSLFVRQFGRGFKGGKLLVNHLTFNPSADRFIFLARNMTAAGTRNGAWATLVVTADREGGGLHVIPNHGYASHYCWEDDRHIVIHADLPGPDRKELCRVRDRSDSCEVLNPEFFRFDGHCSVSPDGKRLLYDSYPDGDGYRKLIVFDMQRKTGQVLAELWSQTPLYPAVIDIRCDLHPRWNRNGNAISFDSTHEGHRHVYWMELPEQEADKG